MCGTYLNILKNAGPNRMTCNIFCELLTVMQFYDQVKMSVNKLFLSVVFSVLLKLDVSQVPTEWRPNKTKLSVVREVRAEWSDWLELTKRLPDSDNHSLQLWWAEKHLKRINMLMVLQQRHSSAVSQEHKSEAAVDQHSPTLCLNPGTQPALCQQFRLMVVWRCGECFLDTLWAWFPFDYSLNVIVCMSIVADHVLHSH